MSARIKGAARKRERQTDRQTDRQRERERERERERKRERERERKRPVNPSAPERTNHAPEKAGRRQLRNVANREFRDVPWSHVASLTATFSLLLARESQSLRVGDPGPATNTFLRKLEMDG